MSDVSREVDRFLTLLRNKIREQGFTQLDVQRELRWGRSYISQLLTKQKSLRVEQVLQILDVIGVRWADFFAELYRFPEMPPAPDGSESFREERDRLAGVVRLLLDKQVITEDELDKAVDTRDRSATRRPVDESLPED